MKELFITIFSRFMDTCYQPAQRRKSRFTSAFLCAQLVLFFSLLLHTALQAQNCSTVQVNASINHASCGINSDGAVQVTVTGGTAPYVYEWSDGTKTRDLQQVAAGAYTLSVTDAEGCQTTQTYTVDTKASFTLDYTVNTLPSTQYAADGQVDIQIAGGQAPYNIFVSNYADQKNVKRYATKQPHLEKMTAGNYLVDVSDANGCMATVSINLKSQNK